MTKPRFFATASEFRSWLEKHHDDSSELWLGFYKRRSGKPSITYPEAVDEALCFGWIDGVRKSLDEESYVNRFTPRRRGSNWSLINIKRVEELTRLGLMRPTGLRAFEQRAEQKSGTYSYEQRNAARLDSFSERRFRANRKAWEFFQRQAPSYRKAAVWWVVSAKKEETRRRRLTVLIEHSERGQTIPPLRRPSKPR